MIPWPFDRTYMQFALAAGLVVGACAPLIGAFLVQRKMSLMGDGMGHLAFAGVGGALLLGVWPLWGALLTSVAGALLIEWLRSRGRASGDLALAIAFYVGIAAGVVLLGLGGALNASLFSYLFGSILTVTVDEVLAVVGLGAGIVLTFGLTRRALFAAVADEEWARVAGLPVAALNALLSVLTAVIVVASMQVVGLLLVAALMVLPVASAQLLARSFRGTLAWSAGIGAGSAIAGLVAARAWALAPSGTIVLVAAGFFAAVATAVGWRRRRTGAAERPGGLPSSLVEAIPRDSQSGG